MIRIFMLILLCSSLAFARGKDSGNGGHGVLVQFYKKMQEIIDQLPQNNPDGLRGEDLEAQLDSLKIKLVEGSAEPVYNPSTRDLTLSLQDMEKRFQEDDNGVNDVHSFLYRKLIRPNSSYNFSDGIRNKALSLYNFVGGKFLSRTAGGCELELTVEKPALWVQFKACAGRPALSKFICYGDNCISKLHSSSFGQRQRIRFLTPYIIDLSEQDADLSWTRFEIFHRQSKQPKDPQQKVFFEGRNFLNGAATFSENCERSLQQSRLGTLRECLDYYPRCEAVHHFLATGFLVPEHPKACVMQVVVQGHGPLKKLFAKTPSNPISFSEDIRQQNRNDWIEGELRARLENIYKYLHKFNPDHLNLQEVRNYLDSLKMEFYQSVLNSEHGLAEMLNFPDYNLLQVDSRAMEERLLSEELGFGEIHNYLYHEIIPKFKGPEASYQHSRRIKFKVPEINVKNFQAGNFVADMGSTSHSPVFKNCMLKVRIRGKDLAIQWDDSPTGNGPCPSERPLLLFHCEGSLCLSKVIRDYPNSELRIRLISEDIIEFGWRSYDEGSSNNLSHYRRLKLQKLAP